MGFVYFFSYARQDSDARLEQFRDALAQDVRSVTGVPAEQVAFHDTQAIDLGEAWDPTISRALRTSQVMVCICSATYFKREYCGKEVEVFLRRRQAAGNPPVILPVMWTRGHWELPECLAALQFHTDTLPSAYAERHLRALVGLSATRDDYLETVRVLAERIDQIRMQHPMPDGPELPALARVPSAFGAVRAGSVVDVAGGGAAELAFVAADSAQIGQAGRRDLTPYPDGDARQWRPFLPVQQEPIGRLAYGVCLRENLLPEPIRDLAELERRIDDARKAGNLVVVIVDVWTLKVAHYQERLRACDRMGADNVLVIVIWNAADPETADHRGGLLQAVLATFPGGFIDQHPAFWLDEVSSGEAFETHLAQGIERVRSRLRAKPRREVPVAPGDPRPHGLPLLQGPGRSGAR